MMLSRTKGKNGEDEERMSAKRMNKRLCRDGSFRLRFYHAHADQIEIIELALERAREESGSEFDIVLLELICMAYLTSAHLP
jgi:hypothetical protein